jgi:hypothetical protein
MLNTPPLVQSFCIRFMSRSTQVITSGAIFLTADILLGRSKFHACMRGMGTHENAGEIILRWNLCSSPSAQTTPRPATLTTIGCKAGDLTEANLKREYDGKRGTPRTVGVCLTEDVFYSRVVGDDNLCE